MDRKNKYVLLDAARMEEEIETAKGMNPEFDSLYRGRSEENLASVAPYIFSLNRGSEFEQWYFEKGWGDSWGILVYSDEDLKTLHKHFRKFLMVQKEDGEELYFRFYDPRVLRIFLPTCDQLQLRELFGPVDFFICEDEEPLTGLVFSFEDKLLKTEKISKEMAINFEPGEKKRKFTFF